MNKENTAKLYDRLDEALQNMYHNATVHIPFDLDLENNEFDYLLEDGSHAIADLQNALKTEDKHWKKQIKLGFTDNERYFWLVQRIVEYGTIYSYGRSGATLAPNHLVSTRGGSSFRIKDSSDLELTRQEVTDLIQILEAFNKYVRDWNSAENVRFMILDGRECRLEDSAA